MQQKYFLGGRTLTTLTKRGKYIGGKVQIFWEGHNIFRKSSLYFWLALHRTKIRWRFRKILWPSQNILTLTKLSSKWLAALNHKAKIGTSTGQGQQEVICSTICKMLTQACNTVGQSNQECKETSTIKCVSHVEKLLLRFLNIKK